MTTKKGEKGAYLESGVGVGGGSAVYSTNRNRGGDDQGKTRAAD